MFSVLGAIAIAVILPMIDTYGVAVSYALCALLIWISYGYVVGRSQKKFDLLLMR